MISHQKICWINHHFSKKIEEIHFYTDIILFRVWHGFKAGFLPLCSFCKAVSESASELFSTCSLSQEIWIDAALLIPSAFNTLTTISEEIQLFLDCNTDSEPMNYSLKVKCLNGKFHIHISRITQAKSNINLFCIELQYLNASVSKIANNK